jgi:hypothetical protein
MKPRAKVENDGNWYVLVAALQLPEPCQPEFLALDGQPAALVVVEPGLFAQLLLEDFDFFLKVLDGVLLVAIDPTRQAKEEKLKMIHPGRVGVGPQFSEKFCRGGGYAFY